MTSEPISGSYVKKESTRILFSIMTVASLSRIEWIECGTFGSRLGRHDSCGDVASPSPPVPFPMPILCFCGRHWVAA